MKRRSLIIILVAAVLCTLAVFAGYSTGAKSSRRGMAFTLRATLTHYQPGGAAAVEDVTRYESADGSWREVRRSGEHLSDQFFKQGRGYFNVNHAKRLLIRGRGSKTRDNVARASASELIKSPQFNRTEILLGYTAYVMQIRDGETLMSEVYVVPELGATPVKSVSFDTGGQVISVLEPVSITPGEPAAADLKGPAYPEAAGPHSDNE